MEEGNLQSPSVQSSDKLVINQPDSLVLESQSTSEENETDIPQKLDHKDRKQLKVIKESSNCTNVKTTYCTCLVSNDSDKNCDAQLKIVGGSTLNLISHLWKSHGIMQNGSNLYEPDDK
ncbi:11746_t:CDS:2 [Dentiscutata erythropus]|uniref:11746_t:CDS:1 n=1 Tax=Dentiscutata erythropus TaxID=1348616 RepID=A0A9N9NWR5_9GLOM|nr:11746_t:CDS:2 [Dentiscutata erythropus]